MADTIETFVEKLQTEGVQAGQQQADRLISDAGSEAEKLITDAKAQGEKIIADANQQAEGIVARGNTDLGLAARDAMLKLRDALSDTLRSLLEHSAKAQLTDVEFLGKTLHELILMYAKDEQSAKQGFRINVPDEVREQLAEWAIQEIGRERIENVSMPIDLKGTLSAVGFEYTTAGGTVEITLESVVDVMSELVSPALKEILDGAKGQA